MNWTNKRKNGSLSVLQATTKCTWGWTATPARGATRRCVRVADDRAPCSRSTRTAATSCGAPTPRRTCWARNASSKCCSCWCSSSSCAGHRSMSSTRSPCSTTWPSTLVWATPASASSSCWPTARAAATPSPTASWTPASASLSSTCSAAVATLTAGWWRAPAVLQSRAATPASARGRACCCARGWRRPSRSSDAIPNAWTWSTKKVAARRRTGKWRRDSCEMWRTKVKCFQLRHQSFEIRLSLNLCVQSLCGWTSSTKGEGKSSTEMFMWCLWVQIIKYSIDVVGLKQKLLRDCDCMKLIFQVWPFWNVAIFQFSSVLFVQDVYSECYKQ